MELIDKIEILSKERQELREIVLLMVQAMHRCAFAFLTIAVTATGLYYSNGLIDHQALKEDLVMFLTQVEVGLCLFFCGSFATQNVVVGHIRSIEDEINTVAKEDLVIYESEIATIFIWGAKSPFFYISIFIFLFAVAALVLLVVIGYQVASFWMGVLLAVEFIAVVTLFIWSAASTNLVHRFSRDIMGRPLTHRKAHKVKLKRTKEPVK